MHSVVNKAHRVEAQLRLAQCYSRTDRQQQARRTLMSIQKGGMATSCWAIMISMLQDALGVDRHWLQPFEAYQGNQKGEMRSMLTELVNIHEKQLLKKDSLKVTRKLILALRVSLSFSGDLITKKQRLANLHYSLGDYAATVSLLQLSQQTQIAELLFFLGDHHALRSLLSDWSLPRVRLAESFSWDALLWECLEWVYEESNSSFLSRVYPSKGCLDSLLGTRHQFAVMVYTQLSSKIQSEEVTVELNENLWKLIAKNLYESGTLQAKKQALLKKKLSVQEGAAEESLSIRSQLKEIMRVASGDLKQDCSSFVSLLQSSAEWRYSIFAKKSFGGLLSQFISNHSPSEAVKQELISVLKSKALLATFSQKVNQEGIIKLSFPPNSDMRQIARQFYSWIAQFEEQINSLLQGIETAHYETNPFKIVQIEPHPFPISSSTVAFRSLARNLKCLYPQLHLNGLTLPELADSLSSQLLAIVQKFPPQNIDAMCLREISIEVRDKEEAKEYLRVLQLRVGDKFLFPIDELEECVIVRGRLVKMVIWWGAMGYLWSEMDACVSSPLGLGVECVFLSADYSSVIQQELL